MNTELSERIFIEEIITGIEIQIKELGVSLANGNASTLEDYRYKVGIIKGLQKSIDIIEESYKQYLNDEDE